MKAQEFHKKVPDRDTFPQKNGLYKPRS